VLFLWLVLLSVVCVGRLTFHKFVFLFCVPLRMVLSLCVIVMVFSVNVAVQSASQSCPTDSSEVVPRAGNMWAVRAALGKFGKSNLAVWVAVIVS